MKQKPKLLEDSQRLRIWYRLEKATFVILATSPRVPGKGLKEGKKDHAEVSSF